eukprot:1150998-Pelagomonas_calceolata.AAC.2
MLTGFCYIHAATNAMLTLHIPALKLVSRFAHHVQPGRQDLSALPAFSSVPECLVIQQQLLMGIGGGIAAGARAFEEEEEEDASLTSPEVVSACVKAPARAYARAFVHHCLALLWKTYESWLPYQNDPDPFGTERTHQLSPRLVPDQTLGSTAHITTNSWPSPQQVGHITATSRLSSQQAEHNTATNSPNSQRVGHVTATSTSSSQQGKSQQQYIKLDKEAEL